MIERIYRTMGTSTVARIWWIPAVILLLHVHCTLSDFHSPCYGCRLFNILHQEHPDPNQKDTAWCHYPCQCPIEVLKCRDGVSVIKDGCGCCYMCARQQGDICSPRDRCDTAKELFCDSKSKNETGICRARVQNPCLVDGVLYKDGEQFEPDCTRVCTCQNGFYGCVSKCPDESRPPSDSTCIKPKLLPVPGKCCKEWTCQKIEAHGSPLYGIRGLESEALIIADRPPDSFLTTTRTTTVTTTSTVRPFCQARTTQWSPCSVTCDAGVSVRIVTDPVTCQTRQDRRICYLRPCGMVVETYGRDKCTPTTRSARKLHVQYQDCVSLREYRLKWCTSCKKDRCCYPKRVRTRIMRFQCTGGTRESLQFMWIKKCRCDRKCYREDKQRKRKRRRRRRRRYRDTRPHFLSN